MTTVEYDYVIVGAGSAGCVLANRLTEDGATVLLLEAGKWDHDPLIHIPLGIGKIFPERRHDWNYFMEPDAALAARAIECARGRVIGGSSSINVMAYVRGHRTDYDRWAASGLPGWGYADILPYFRRSEAWEGGSDPYRGDGGLLRVQQTRYDDPILGAFIAAGQAAGYKTPLDYNGADQDGFALIQETIHRGRRWSAATAYLKPALRRPALRVEVAAQVSRVILNGARATGVAYTRAGQARAAMARREVILCGGVIDTPKLLMLSGIGNPAQLAPHGIETIIAAAGVGQNLQDHLSVLVTHRRQDVSSFTKAMRYDRLARSMVQAWVGGCGYAGDVPIGATAFLRTRPGLPAPDVQLLFLAAPFPARAYMPPFSAPVVDGFGCRIALLRPQSRGRVTLASHDPAVAPKIAGQFLSAADDLDTLLRGIGLLRHVFGQAAMTPHAAEEIAPGPDAVTRAQLEIFVRNTAVTVHHPAGTCRMGAQGDTGRVVDAELRVCGVERLRVVDASVMPDLVGGNINAVVMAIAEKAADLIRGRAPPPAADFAPAGTRYVKELT